MNSTLLHCLFEFRNKKLSLHFLNKVCMFAATNNKNLSEC